MKGNTVNIAAETALIRAGWSESQHRRRAGMSIPRWSPPTISATTLIDAAREAVQDDQEQFQMPERPTKGHVR